MLKREIETDESAEPNPEVAESRKVLLSYHDAAPKKKGKRPLTGLMAGAPKKRKAELLKEKEKEEAANKAIGPTKDKNLHPPGRAIYMGNIPTDLQVSPIEKKNPIFTARTKIWDASAGPCNVHRQYTAGPSV
eukprot:g3555.t1